MKTIPRAEHNIGIYQIHERYNLPCVCQARIWGKLKNFKINIYVLLFVCTICNIFELAKTYSEAVTRGVL